MNLTDFKVGDTIVGVGHHHGETGTVTAVRSMYVYAKLEAGWTGVFWPSELKLVKPAPKFKKGDIVKSVGFQYTRHEGKTLIIHGPSKDKGYAYQVRALGEDYRAGHDYREDELVAGETLAEWEIELLDSSRPSLKSGTYGLSAKDEAWAQKNKKGEAVKHPAHYGGGDNPYEAIKVIEAWGLGFNLGNAAKYLARAGKKGNKVEDLNKLIQYVQFEIAKEEAIPEEHDEDVCSAGYTLCRECLSYAGEEAK